MDHNFFFNNKTTKIWILFILVFIGEIFFYTWCRVQCVKYGYNISELTSKREKLIARQKIIKIEIAHLKSPRKIAKIARSKLGLTVPKTDQIILIP